MNKIYVALVVLASCILMQGCSYDFIPDGDLWLNYKPRVVVNSIICPDSTISVKLFWSKQSNSQTKGFDTVKFAHVRVNENDTPIIDTDVKGGVARSQIHPKAGARYSIHITVPDYGELTATTYIPEQPKIDAKFVKEVGDRMQYAHFIINSIELPQQSEALWIVGTFIFNDASRNTMGPFYANNPYPDHINLELDSEDVSLKGSNVGYGEFVRTERDKVKYMFPFEFSTHFFCSSDTEYDPETGEIIGTTEKYPEKMYVTALATSEDYDNYHRTAYRQKQNHELPSLDDTKHVYCNITNGLGIFAGYSSASFLHQYKPRR